MTPTVDNPPHLLVPQDYPRSLITVKQVMGAIAQWVCRQSPYNSVNGVDQINLAVRQHAENWSEGFTDLRMEWFDSPFDLRNWLLEIFLKDLTCLMLNTPRKPRDKSNQTFIMRDNNPDHDFIDLHALAMNVALTCFKEAE